MENVVTRPIRNADGTRPAPTVSVAIAAYNSEKWIAETLESVLAQTTPAHEVIVIDDGSTDDTSRELERYRSRDRVRILKQVNLGVSAALNRAFEKASGELVALCGADDLWDRQKLEWQSETFAADPRIDIAFGHARMFGIVQGDFVRPSDTGVLDGPALARRMYAGNIIAAPSAVIRRSLHQELGGFREDLAGEDYEFWMRALRAGAVFYYDPRLILHYRRHGENLSMPGGRRDVHLRPVLEMNYLIHRWYADMVPAAEVRRALAKDLCDLGRHLVDVGPPADAGRALRASLRRRPSIRAITWLVLLRLRPEARERVVAMIAELQRATYRAAAQLRRMARSRLRAHA
jgi:glycosyltransferase involved in cell wall biosynthesis